MKKREEIINAYINGYNSFDTLQMTKHLSRNILFDSAQDNKANMHLKGIEAFSQQAVAAKGYFTEREPSPSNFVHYADLTKVDITYQGEAPQLTFQMA